MEMWNVSWIFAPITIQKHNVIAALQLGKNVFSSPTKDFDAPREISLLERLLCKSRMLWVLFNCVYMTVRSCRGSHHGGRVSVAAPDL
jgi:hypothetical protein